MSTKNEIISDIELRLYKGKPSDDSELSKRHISYLLDNLRSEILTDHLNQIIKNGDPVNPFYIFKEECNELTKEVSLCDAECKTYRYYFDISRDVLFLRNDKGIVRVTDNYGRSLIHSDETYSEVLVDLPYNNVSYLNQAFYRENNRIYILSHTPISSSYYKYNVYYIPEDIPDDYDNDEDYPLEDSLIPLLTDRAEEILRNQMQNQLSEVDLSNDGTDPYHK